MTSALDYPLSTRDVSVQLGVHLDTVLRWAKKGEIACWVSPGGHHKFRQPDVDAFAQTLVQIPVSRDAS